MFIIRKKQCIKMYWRWGFITHVKKHICIIGFYSEMSILAGKPKFTSWEADFGRAGWRIQNKVTKLSVKSSDEIRARLKYLQAFHTHNFKKNASLSAPDICGPIRPVNAHTIIRSIQRTRSSKYLFCGKSSWLATFQNR